MIAWLARDTPFPPIDTALREPNGLLAAYRRGIFPWYSRGEPILWWSPDPRMVLFPAELKVSRSLAKRLRRGDCEVRCDTAFAEVVRACAAPREPGGGTWITAEMQRAYRRMHELGYAHSVETWQEGALVGGLYGMEIGRVFFGESMFARATDASKVALAHLARFLESRGFAMIDCQMSTAHLASLGAREIPRREFIARLAQATPDEAPARWPADALAAHGPTP
jgi:leucyl/phenylalanyl-tRNA--protein transferase